MTAEERENLHNLHVASRNAWGRASDTNQQADWDVAYAADRAFSIALFAMDVAL